METLFGPYERAAMRLVEPINENLFAISETPLYASPSCDVGAYQHLGLRANVLLQRGQCVLREQPSAYAPVGQFVIKENVEVADYHTGKEDGSPSPSNKGEGGIRIMSHDELKELAGAKADFFRQGWPFMSPFLAGYPNQEYLHLTCILIHRAPAIAELISGPSYFRARPPLVAPATWDHFRACMNTLCFFKTARRVIRPWVVYENFVRLYDAVVANAIACVTLCTEQRFALGIYPLAARLNHSCRPNCVRIGTPTGVYVIATEEIAQGQELTISYISPMHLQARRDSEGCYEKAHHEETRATLEKQFGFDCTCVICRSRTPIISSAITNNGLDDGNVELTRALEEFESALASNAPLAIYSACENFRRNHAEKLQTNAWLGHKISRAFVWLMRPGTLVGSVSASEATSVSNNCSVDRRKEEMTFSAQLCLQTYPFWAKLYQAAIVEMQGEDSVAAIRAQFFVSVHTMIETNCLLRESVYQQIVSEESQSATTQGTTSIADSGDLQARRAYLDSRVTLLFDEYIALRQLCRRVIGSHYFIWLDHFMYFGLDIVLKEMEEPIVKIERAMLEDEKSKSDQLL